MSGFGRCAKWRARAIPARGAKSDYGLGTILGEETTDLATTYGAMESFDLPRTGIPVGYAKALLIRPNGNREARGVVPDIPIATPVVLKHDVVLERALAAIDARES